jgi:acetyl-CoA acetyltransferase
MTPFGVHAEATVKGLTAAAVSEALSDSGAATGDVEAVFFGNASQGHLEGQNAIRGQVALRPAGFVGVPITNVENACATGSTALHLAVNQIRGGLADIALAVGVEKMTGADPIKALTMFTGGYDISDPDALERTLAEIGGPDATDGGGARSIFMDIYAAVARGHMQAFGTTQRQLAEVSAKNHRHALANPRAHFRRDMSAEDILTARPLAFPITVPMCAPITDGAAAVVVCSQEGLRRLSGRPVRVLACVLGSGSDRSFDDWEHTITRRLAGQAYEESGVGPQDVSVAEVHDATAFAEISQSELLGFTELGGGGRLAESGATTLGGRLPINPSGGLESKGHPLGATGLGQVYELVSQLRGDSGERQVDGARVALAENGGGFLGTEEAAAVVTILGQAG